MTSRPHVRAAICAALLASASAAHAGRGGPDAWGNTWYDAVDGCAPDVSDPFDQGTPGTFTQNFAGPFEIGFEFPFYDRRVTQVWLHRSGLVFFSAPANLQYLLNEPIPNVGGPAGFIAPFWDALEVYKNPTFFTQSFADRGYFKIAMDLRPIGVPSPVTFEIYLYRNGDIRIEYLAEPGPPYGSTIGMESFAEDMGLEVFRDGVSPGGFTLANPMPHSLCIVRDVHLDCSEASTLSCGALTSATPATSPSAASLYDCDPGLWTGTEAIYRLDLTGMWDLSAILTNTGQREMGLFLIDGCDEFDCLTGGGISVSAQSLAPGTYHLVIDPRTPDDDGNFRADIACTAVSTPLTCGEVLLATTDTGLARLDGYTSGPARDCSGPEAYFTVELFGRSPLNVSLDTSHAVFLYDASDSPRPDTALAGGTGGAVLYDAPPGQYIIVVDGSPAEAGPFTLSVNCAPEVRCASPVAAPRCSQILDGTTVGLPGFADFYDCNPRRMAGPEAVYEFQNDVTQVVSFVIDDAADESLDLFLLSACDEGACIKYGDKEVSVLIPAGTYFLVVDSPSAAAPFRLSTICGNTLQPETIAVTGAAGECFQEHKTTWLTPEISQVDILFAIDLTASMGGARSQLQQNMQEILSQLRNFIRDVEFGLVSYRDYPYSGSYSLPCAYSSIGGGYGAPTDYPYRLHQAITGDVQSMQAAVDGLPPAQAGTDNPESYTRMLYEAYTDTNIGWRTGSRRVIMNFGDDLPHDCNVVECLGGAPGGTRGIDLGPDGRPNTTDDLRIMNVINELVTNQTMLIHLNNSAANASTQGFTYTEIWNCWAQMTGGIAEHINSDGTVPPQLHPDGLSGLLGDLLQERGFLCDTLTLEATAGYEGWLASVSPSYIDVPLPSVREFDIEVCVPPGTPDGDYEFGVQVLCGTDKVAQQQVVVSVTGSCAATVVYRPSDATVCEGGMALLDASGMTLVNCRGTEVYTWTDGVNSYPDPVILVSPADTTRYDVTLTCSVDLTCGTQASATVEVHHPPLLQVVSATDLDPCELGIEVTWEAATFRDPSASGVYNVYRSETDCADAVTRPPVASRQPGPSWTDTTTRAGRSYYYVVEAEDARTSTACLPRGYNNGGAVARACTAAPVLEEGGGVGDPPDGVYSTLRVGHARVGGDVVGHEVSVRWDAARALQPGEHFHLLKALDVPTASFSMVNAEGDLTRVHVEDDRSSPLQFFDLRVASACEVLSLDEYPPGP